MRHLSGAASIFANHDFLYSDQSRLIVALPILFKALAAAGRIGPLEAMVLFSYRDEQQVVHTKQ